MSDVTRTGDLEQRLAELEQRLGMTVEKVDACAEGFDSRLERLEARWRPLTDLPKAPPLPTPTIAPRRGWHVPRPAKPLEAEPGAPWPELPQRESRRSPLSLEDLLAGRVLAWIGGAATLLGIVLFLALAVSRGWIGVEARVVLAAVAACALTALGVWLHDHRGRTEASRALVGTGMAGMFATLVVAGDVYQLIPPAAAIAGCLLVGALATTLAILWAGQAIAGLGLVGALLSPLLAGAVPDDTTLAILAVTSGFAVAVVIAQRWRWLAVLTALVCAPQWIVWALESHATALKLLVLAWFTVVGLASAIGPVGLSRPDLDAPEQRPATASVILVTLSAFVVAMVGPWALPTVAGKGWLIALAAVHAVLGLRHVRQLWISPAVRRLLVAIGVMLADVAFALIAGGPALAIGWGAAAVGFAWLLRRSKLAKIDERLLSVGLGAHVGLTLLRALIEAPPHQLGLGLPQLDGIVAVAALASGCIASAQLLGEARRWPTVALNALGLAAVAYLTAQTLTGPALVVAWALEACALSQLARHTDEVAGYGALAFLGLAAIHAVIIEAPASSLLTGAPSLSDAAIALGAISAAALAIARGEFPVSQLRYGLRASAAGWMLYLGSVAIITVFQPTGALDTGLLDLSLRQEGQALLSASWGLLGLGGLILGLRMNRTVVRNAALGLLLVTVGKVFLYDLSTLTSIYRVASFIVLGLLLLAGAFFYQRMRPGGSSDS